MRWLACSERSAALILVSLLALGPVLAACGAPADATDDSSAAVTTASTADGGSSSSDPDAGSSEGLLAEVEEILATMKSTHYQHDSHVDATAGVYDVDCSGFVNLAIGAALPDGFAALQRTTLARPLAGSYVTFIAGLTPLEQAWTRVEQVDHLVPGDIIAWRIPAEVKSDDTGHVMVVETAPVITTVTGGQQAQIAVVDSTEYGHGDADPRTPSGATGIGRGTIVLVVADDGTASGYRWSTDADSPPYTTDVVMAHLD